MTAFLRVVRRSAPIALTACCLTACNNFLSGPDLTQNPNRPSQASPDQLFVGVQVQTMAEFTGRYPLQLLPMFARQFAGVARQWATYDSYNGSPNENDADAAFNDTYTSGGLSDMRQIEAAAKAAGNDRFLGIAQVYEALRVGTAADLFGDIPYSDAASGKTNPKLDSQASVYTAVQALLDQAIANLSDGKGNGPTAVDFIYGNDATKWIAAAHTLKARFYMHTSRASDSVTTFGKAIAEAQKGIQDPSGDWVVTYTSTAGEQNLYANFLNSRAGDIEPDSLFIAVLLARNDNQLLTQYYNQRAGCGYAGSTPTKGGGQCVSDFNITVTTPMSLVTAAENWMILAEAQYRSGQQATALTTLNTYRNKVGYGPVAATGVNILMAILQEKYVRLYLNPEVYFDYLRTCYPNFPIAGYAKIPYVPARFPYGYSERIANSNIPDPSDQPLANANFPKNLVDPTGATCFGQASRPGT